VPKPHLAPTPTSVELEPTPFLAAIVDAVVLPDRRLLIAYRSGLAKLVGFDGKEIWRAQLNGLHGLVPVGDGHSVLLLRDDLGMRRLSVLETAGLHHRELGPFPVSFYHPWADALHWLVFSGRDAMSLDVPALLAGQSATGGGEFVRHWAIPMSEPGHPLFFIETGAIDTAVHFVWERDDQMVEWWSLFRRNLAVTFSYWTDPFSADDKTDDAVISVDQQLGFWTSFAPSPATTALARLQYITRDEELRMIAQLRTFPDQRQLIQVQPAASPKAIRWRATSQQDGVTWFGRLSTKEAFEVRFPGAEWVHAHPHLHHPLTSVFDDRGRLLVIDMSDNTVSLKML